MKKCKKCGKFKVKAKGFCEKCYRETLRKKCYICKKLNITATRRNGKIICQSCNKKYFYKPKKCGSCKEIKKIKAKGQCEKCYRNTLKKVCDICGKTNVISTKKKGEIICHSCNKKYFTKTKKKECSLCKRTRRIDKMENKKPICSTCYKRFFYNHPKDICYICKEFKEREGFHNKNPICGSCYRINIYKRKKEICDNCSELGVISLIKNNKKFCRKCYKKIRKEHYKALNHTRIARKKGNGGKITEKEIKQIFKRDQKCVYCGKKEKLSLDHIIPISTGGRSEFNNYVIACLSCNISKGKKEVFKWCKQKRIKVPKKIKELLKKQEAMRGN